MGLNDMPNEPSQHKKDNNSLSYTTIDWLAMQGTCTELLTSRATAHYGMV